MREVPAPRPRRRFDPLSTQLAKIDRLLRDQLERRPDAGEAAEAGEPDAAANSGGRRRSGRRHPSRAGCRSGRSTPWRTFFRQTEPSSPVPLFLERAKRLVSKDFLEVLADIAPDALEQARAAGGLKTSE